MKKSRERIHLEHFKEICSFFPDGEIEGDERPDFIVHAVHKNLGIEHTEIFQPGVPHGDSLQAQDSLAQRVVDKANELYSNNNKQPLFVQILFIPREKIHKQDIDRIAETIVRLIETTLIESNIPITLKRSKENVERFPKEIAMVHIFCRKNGKENRWVCSSAASIPQLAPEQIQEKIDNKEKKLESYKPKCEEIWLLIVADDFRIPSSVDLTELATTYCYITRFDRVFFFWNSSRRYIELHVTNIDNNRNLTGKCA